MRGRKEERIEGAVDRLAACTLALAAAFSAFFGLRQVVPQPQLAISVTVLAAAIYLACSSVLKRIAPEQAGFVVAGFELPELDLAQTGDLLLTEQVELLLTEQVELLLTDADRVSAGEAAKSEDELILDDILAELGPDSRVVRLFDRSAMPTPGQLNARIERHLRHGAPPAAPVQIIQADASQALYDALAELRRSLR